MFLSIYLEDFERWAGDVVEGAQVFFGPSGLLVLAASPKPSTPEIIIKGTYNDSETEILQTSTTKRKRKCFEGEEDI